MAAFSQMAYFKGSVSEKEKRCAHDYPFKDHQFGDVLGHLVEDDERFRRVLTQSDTNTMYDLQPADVGVFVPKPHDEMFRSEAADAKSVRHEVVISFTGTRIGEQIKNGATKLYELCLGKFCKAPDFETVVQDIIAEESGGESRSWKDRIKNWFSYDNIASKANSTNATSTWQWVCDGLTCIRQTGNDLLSDIQILVGRAYREEPDWTNARFHQARDLTNAVCERYPHASTIYITGHSLGGALSLEAAYTADPECQKRLKVVAFNPWVGTLRHRLELSCWTRVTPSS